MSRLRSFPGRALAVLGMALLPLGALACDEDGRTVPEYCPALPIYDIQDPPADDGAAGASPCVTAVGHAIGPASAVAGGGSGGTNSTSGSGGLGGSPGDAGAGGA